MRDRVDNAMNDFEGNPEAGLRAMKQLKRRTKITNYVDV